MIDIEKFKRIDDLVYYDGPLLSLYKDNLGGAWLCSWLDCTHTYNEWAFVQLADGVLEPLLRGQKTLYEALATAKMVESFKTFDTGKWEDRSAMSVADLLDKHGPDKDATLTELVDNADEILEKFRDSQ